MVIICNSIKPSLQHVRGGSLGTALMIVFCQEEILLMCFLTAPPQYYRIGDILFNETHLWALLVFCGIFIFIFLRSYGENVIGFGSIEWKEVWWEKLCQYIEFDRCNYFKAVIVFFCKKKWPLRVYKGYLTWLHCQCRWYKWGKELGLGWSPAAHHW